MSIVAPTTDALARVFDAETRDEYVEYLAVTPPAPHASHVRWRLGILTAHGPRPSDPLIARRVKQLRARRASFETYVSAAETCGLLDANMLGRLRSVEERNFRSALSECLTCWLFAGVYRYTVSPCDGGGRPGKQVEFGVTAPANEFIVEVKAPAVDPPADAAPVRIEHGDDAPTLEEALKNAARQFAKGAKNLLVIVPSLRTSVWSRRDQLVKALIGEPVIQVYVPLDDDGEGFTEPGFRPRGVLVRRGNQLPDGSWLPANTRVSAVMVIEVVEVERAALLPSPAEGLFRQLEEARQRSLSPENAFWPEHRVLVVHNPNAECPINPETFGAVPQLVRVSETEMAWTDREEGGDDDDDD